MYAATVATTPSGERPWFATCATPVRAARSAAFPATTWAHLRPGTFQALDAATIVVTWSAVPSTVAYGVCTAPGSTSGAWISSLTTRPPA